MTATEAKGRNLFHAPGPNRQYGPQYVLGPDGLPAPLNPVPGMGPGFIPRINGGPGMAPVGAMGQGGAGSASGLSNNIVRQRRRLYVGGVTYDCTADNMRALFNERLASIGTTTDETGITPCIDVQISHEKSYAFVEVRSDLPACSFAAIRVAVGPLPPDTDRPCDCLAVPLADRGDPGPPVRQLSVQQHDPENSAAKGLRAR